ncbi:hypothetical protein BpHYR1_046595 [Brachionus plicatilis]|uniref:Uncharacterized protein n=1 Tax=Brachionus plicatilis TaxID=10195 RepID=A0A3M7S328_BRAPC|nr:hypothetical protein BpHYR1_046595 [Brachionus plicatilis]
MIYKLKLNGSRTSGDQCHFAKLVTRTGYNLVTKEICDNEILTFFRHCLFYVPIVNYSPNSKVSFIIQNLMKNIFLFKSKSKNFDLKFTFDHELQFADFNGEKAFDEIKNNYKMVLNLGGRPGFICAGLFKSITSSSTFLFLGRPLFTSFSFSLIINTNF